MHIHWNSAENYDGHQLLSLLKTLWNVMVQTTMKQWLIQVHPLQITITFISITSDGKYEITKAQQQNWQTSKVLFQESTTTITTLKKFQPKTFWVQAMFKSVIISLCNCTEGCENFIVHHGLLFLREAQHCTIQHKGFYLPEVFSMPTSLPKHNNTPTHGTKAPQLE